MPTEIELRAACAELAEDAPDLDHILADVDRKPHRRLLAPLAAAAVVVAIAVAVVLLGVTRTKHESARPPADFVHHACDTQTTPTFDTFAIGRMGRAEPNWAHGYSGSTDIACAGYRSRLIEVRVPHGGSSGAVTLFAPGTVDQHLLANPRRVTDAGINGYAGRLRADPTRLCSRATIVTVPMNTVSCNSPALMWQYAPHAWGLVQVPHAPPSTLLDVAAAVRPANTPVRFPAVIRGVAAGLRPVRVVVTSVISNGVAALPGTDPGIHSGSVTYRTTSQALALTATVNSTPLPLTGVGSSIDPPARRDDGTMVAKKTHGRCTLTLTAWDRTIAAAQLRAILRATIVPAHCANPNTWPTAQQAVGG